MQVSNTLSLTWEPCEVQLANGDRKPGYQEEACVIGEVRFVLSPGDVLTHAAIRAAVEDGLSELFDEDVAQNDRRYANILWSLRSCPTVRSEVQDGHQVTWIQLCEILTVDGFSESVLRERDEP